MGIVAVFGVIEGEQTGVEYAFSEVGTYLVGRSRNCGLTIPREIDPTLSRFHCSISLTEQRVMIRDLGSSNGTYVNEVQLESSSTDTTESRAIKAAVVLKNGDIVRLGNTVFKLLLEGLPETDKDATGEHPNAKVLKLHTQNINPGVIKLPDKPTNQDETVSLGGHLSEEIKQQLQEHSEKGSQPLKGKLLSLEDKGNQAPPKLAPRTPANPAGAAGRSAKKKVLRLRKNKPGD